MPDRLRRATTRTAALTRSGNNGAVLIDADERNFEPHQDSISIKGNNEGYCGGTFSRASGPRCGWRSTPPRAPT